MPIYTTSYGKRYNIPSDIAAQFEKDFPDAQIRYEASGEEYDIPLNKRDGFIKAFPNAKTVDRMSTPPKEDAQPEYSGPGGYFAPKPRNEPNPSALIAEEVERQQRQAGINPNSAEAISQRFDAMVEALPSRKTKEYDDQLLLEDDRRREEQYNKTHRLGMMQAQNPEGYAPYPQRSDDEKTNSRFLPLANVGDETSAVWMIPQPEDYPAPSPEAQRIWERRINEAKAQSQFESGVRGQLWEITKTLDEQDRKNDEEVRQWREESHKRALDGLGALPIPPSTPEESRSYSNLKTAQGLLDEAVKVIEQADRNTHGATGVGNALRGIKDGLFDPHTWDLGIGELVDANNLRRVIAKSDRNETLTDDERSLLDALATNMAVSSLYGSKVGMGYNIGKGTAQSLPFMIEFALNPIAGSSKTIAGKIARYWLKHNIKRKALKKAGARVIGDIAAATGTMATSGSLRTAADAITRMTGNPLYEITPEGKAVYAGHEQGDTPLKAIGKSATAGSIEYYTELLGGAFGPIGRAVGGVLGKVPGMKSITGYLSRSQAAELIRGIRTSDWAKSVGDFTSRTGWHGMIEEYSEEEIGNILNYFTVGDVQKKDLLDPQQHLETFGSVALMGGFFSALKTAGYRPARSRAQKQVAIFYQQAGELLGEEWQNIKAACDNNTDPQSGTAALAQVLESSQYNPEQKRAILSYFAAKQSYNGVLLADQKSSEEQTKSPEQTAIENSYDAGYKSVDGDPSAKQAIKQHLNQVSAPFSEERLQELRAVKNPMQYISEHPQEAPQLLEWFKANSTYTGMIEAVQDQIQQKIKESDDAVDSRTHTDGNLYTVTLKGDNAAQGYITQGDVTFNPDGSVNKTKSNDRVTVRYADGHSEMLSIDDLGRLVETNNAQELKAQNADAIWEEESRRAAAEIDGTTGPSQGDPITLKDGRRGIFYADTGDGNYLVQLEDGSVIPAPQTAVTLLNRQPSQQEQQPTPQPAQTTPQQTAEQTMAPSPAQEPQNGVDDRIGRSLNKEEADNLIAEMENRAEPAPELELTLENWTAEFGKDGMVDTPIGKVKMGENQYQKLAQKGRNGKLGMIKPTLTNPDVIIEDKSQAKEGQQTERSSSYVFVKSFIDETGERRYYFTSVTISKEGNEVVISNQERKRNRIHTLFKEGKLIHVKKAALPTESATSAQGNQFTVPGGATLQGKNTNTSANFQTNTTDNQPQNGVDNRIGRSLNKEEADDLIAEMENRAEPAPELELTPENWTAEFGKDGMVDTPIGKVKMGENQYQKLVRNKRENYFGMIKPTLESPDMVVEKVAPADNAERDTKLIFVKTFTKPDGSRVVHFQSVTVKKDGLEVSISSHEAEPKDIKKDMQNATILHISEKMSHGSEGSLTEAPVAEGPDLVPTSDNLSTNEDTTPFAENQIPAGQNNTNISPEATQPPAEVTYPRDEKTGHILFDQIDDPTVVAAALRNEFGEQALEAAQTKLQDLQGELEKAASTKDTFERLYKQRDLQREIAKYQQVVSTLTPTEVEQITPQEMNRAEVQPENVQNETNRSEQQGQETTNADTQTTNADQSEVDENGRPFVKASDGSTVFGEITKDTGLTPAPIKLSEGYQDGNGKGYGRAHIEANHGKQIKKAGFSSVEDFVSYVAKNYNRDNILVGKRRNNGQPTFLIQVSDQHDNTLFVELSGDESYWNVNSAGIFRKGYSNNKETVAKTEPQQPINAVSGDSSLSENEQSGISLSEPNGESTVSTNEDTTNIQENQESASKNTENQTNPLTNKTNTPILPRKQTAPKYAKEIAQFGDEVSIEDVVLRDIALGQKFSWEDHGKSRGIASELGFTGKEAERRSRISMLRNDGITVDDYVHGLWQEYGERFRQDDAQIRDALLDVLQRVYSPKAAMEQLRNIHTQEEFSQEEQNILTPEEREAFWNIPVSEYAFREPKANTPEEQQIIDQAKQNGTYMKAPNGKPTNLTAAQWVKVRTQAFKNWFGDWEKIAKLANSKHKENERNRSKQAPEYTDDFRRVQASSKGLSKQEISEFNRRKREINDAERGLLSGIFGRQLASGRDRSWHDQRTLIDPVHQTPIQILENVDGQLFHDIFEIVRNYLPNGELVDLHENYDNATCYLAADGLSGFAVEDNGNLVSVFNLNPNVSFLKTIKDYVTKCGATHLDGYNSPKQPLAKIYQKTLGWKVASLMDYNMEFDHDDIAANHDAPQVAFMVNSSQDVETKSFDKDSYDEAEAYQQEQVKAIFENCSKVIDENGEPLAVHPVPSSTNTTDEGAGNDQQTGLYFETGGNRTGDRSRQAYFLNIRDPKYSSTQGDLSNTSHDGAILQSQQPGETSSATTYAVTKADQIRPATDLNEARSSDNPDTRYRNIDEVNDQFNAELQQQIEGTLPQGHIYQLGHPSEALQAAGIPNLPIELAASRLETKASKDYSSNHPFDLKNIQNLPQAISSPIAVFDSKTQPNSKVIFIELQQDGVNFVVAVKVHSQRANYQRKININSIRSVYPKDYTRDIINWINRGDLLRWADKEKILNWLTQQQSNSADVDTPIKDISVATNIVNNFENPTLTDGKKVATAEELSETLHTPIRIVRNVNDIHDDEKEAFRKRRACGWYDMETGEVVIVLPNCRDEAEVQATILHEVVGHKGLRELVGEEKYNDLLRRVWSSLDPATKAKKQKQYGHPLIAADEYLASLAEENVEPNVLKRILAQVRNWLREVLGMDIKLSDNDLRYLLWRSKHNLQNKQNIFERAETAAKDAELRYRLGINNQAQDQTENSGSTELDAVNRRFNEQLDAFEKGQMRSNDWFNMGTPGAILQSAGLPNKPITMTQSVLRKHMAKHGFSATTLRNLPDALNSPLMVYEWGDKARSLIVITEIPHGDHRITAAIKLNRNGKQLEVNEIASVHGKSVERLITEMNDSRSDFAQDKLRYVDKKKALNWMSAMEAPLASSQTSSQELSLATNIIKNFENPTLPSEENIRFRENGNELDAVNRRFNEKLETLTEKNADSTVLQLGRPSDILRAAGIADKPLKLYGNKVIKKMKKHGFKLEELQNLPEAVASPIAVFNNYQKEGNRSILTELKTADGNFLVSLDLGKGEDIDFNIVSSVFGKSDNKVINWINKGYAAYIDKEKALNYLHLAAPIAAASDNQELSLATNIIKNFENPTLPSEENIRFREKEAPGDLPTSQASSSQEKLREELKHLRTLRKGLDSEVMQYRKRGAQNESSSTRQLKDIIARYNRSQRQIREYVNDILDAQAATTLGKREINTLLSALVRATDPQKAEEAVHRILDTVTTARLRAETARTEKLYNTKIQGETPQGVPEAKGVDDNTRVMIEYFRAHKEENINESEEALRTKEATEGLTPAEQMHMDAIYLIRLYQQATEVGNDYMAASAQMEQLEQQIDTLSKEVWHLQRAKATGGEARRKRTIEQKQQTMVQKGHLLEATRWQLQELKQNYLEQLQGFNDILQEVILNGRSAYLDWVHKQQDRQREILQGAFADAGPKAMASARQYGGWKPQGPLHKSVLAMRDFFTAPLLSLDYLIRKHTQSAPNGEGHLYNQFIRGEGGYMEASNRYFERTREITDALGEAAQRYMGISGKNMGQRWLRAQAQARRSPLTFSLQLNDGSQPQVISATQALYLRALEKQTDGQVKLRAMGISEEVMEQISQTLQQEAPEMVALADWVQEQLLPSLRESYNATHLRLFGTQMREVAHYFPISINKRETYRENDGTEHEQALPTTTTGSIISRKPNTTAIDWNMDFFEVLDRHIQQMEHWNAYSEVVQNMNRLTSNTLFKKSLEYKNPGEARKFMDAARVAAEQYRIQVLDHESVIVKLSQAAASSKINFRVWTAIKQIASSPAFVAYSADPQFWATLSKHVATLPATLLGRGDYSWAKANLPDFRRRVQGGTAGNDALERESFSVVRKLSKDPRSPLSYGMWANAHMDAVVCAMGAKAVYEYQLSRHKRRGLSESEAQRAARRDAEISYNLSQQSALGVNLSPMQRSRNFFSVIFSTFQNAQFLYGRQLGDALRELTRSTELETEALYQRYRTRGMESAQARRAALKDVSIAKRTSVVRILTYGWGLQLLWVAMSNALPYIFGGDDDDKNLWVESAKNPAVWIGPLQGLFGGGNLTSIAEGYPFDGPMLFEDISRFWRNYGEAAQSQGIFSWETAGVTLDLLTEFSLSQNSETFMNLYNGVQSFIDGHSTAGLLQLINAPRSQIKKILMQRGEHESLMQYAERINNLQELFRAMDRSAQGARGTSQPLYEELEQAN